MSELHYSMYIRWSEQDHVFVVWLPEFGPYCQTHGATYEEAAEKGRELLEMLVQRQKPLPAPHLYGGAHTLTPPDHESRPLESDWFERLSKELDEKHRRTPPRAAAS